MKTYRRAGYMANAATSQALSERGTHRSFQPLALTASVLAILVISAQSALLTANWLSLMGAGASYGTLAAIQAWAIVSAVAGGWVADRVGRRAPLIASLLLTQIAAGTIAMAPSPALVIASTVLFILSSGAMWACAATHALEACAPTFRGLVGGIVVLAGGNLLLVGASLFDVGWQTETWIGVGLAGVCLALLLLTRDADEWRGREPTIAASVPLVAILKGPRLLFVCVALTLGVYVFLTVLSLGLRPWLADSLHMSNEAVRWLDVAGHRALMVGLVVWGLFTTVVGKRLAIALAAALACAMAIGGLKQPSFASISVIGVGFCMGGMGALTLAFQSERFHAGIRATALGLFHNLPYMVDLILHKLLAGGGGLLTLDIYIAQVDRIGPESFLLYGLTFGSGLATAAMLLAPPKRQRS